MRPSLNTSATALRQSGFVERGLDGLGVVGVGDTQVLGSVTPKLGLGVRFGGADGASARFEVTAGRVFNSGSRIEMPYRLVGANQTSNAAMIGVPRNDEGYRGGASLEGLRDDRFNHTGDLREQTERRAASIRVKWKF